MAGIPTVVVTRQGFEGIVANAFAGFGFPAEAPMGYVFPSEMFLIDSDLTPLEENFDALLSGLTEWEPAMKEKGLVEPEKIVVKGADYAEAFANANNLFARNLWRDSLLIVPPTEDVVDWILTGTEIDPDTVLGNIWPRGGVAKVRDIAVSVAMACGRPEYMPLMIAMTKILVEPKTNTQSWNATTNSVLPAFVVNGPMARQIRLASGYGMLGPDPVHPAGGILGRAIRLILQNIGGGIPGTGTMAVFGGMRTVNVVIAEDEEGIPGSWTSLAEDMGFSRDQNVVMMTTVNSMANILWDFGDADANLCCLRTMAGNMAAPNHNRFDGPISAEEQLDDDLTSGLVLLPRAFCAALESANGFSKADVKQFLWDNSKVSYEYVVSCGGKHFIDRGKRGAEGEMCAVTPRPDQIKIVVAGGDQGGHGYWMAPCIMGKSIGFEIELPSNWDDLLFEAEIDMGPIPSAH